MFKCNIKINNKNRGIKKGIEYIHLNLHSKNKSNICTGIKKENNQYNFNKEMRKEKWWNKTSKNNWASIWYK